MSETKTLSLKNYGSAPWTENPEDSKSPIGATLESVKVDSGIGTEVAPVLRIEVTLMGNMHDGRVKLAYEGVHTYSMAGFATNDPNGNVWIEDALELNKTNRVKHKVSFTGGNWSIEADDLQYNWEPF